MRWLLSLLTLCASVAFAGPVDEVLCHEIGFSRSVEQGDPAWFRSFIDDDARFVGGSVRRGVDDVASAWSVFFTEGGPRIQWRPQYVEVLESGDLALSRGPFRMTSMDGEGNPVEVWGTFNSTWRRQTGGGWKVVFDAGSNEPESPGGEVKALLNQQDDCGVSVDMKTLHDFAVRYAAAWSGGDPAAFAAFYAENGSLRINDGEPAVGRVAVEQMARDFMTAFPDMVVRLVELKRVGTAVEFHWHWTGTNTGPEGTGAAVDLTGYESWTLDADGLILESRGHLDDAEYQRQLQAGGN